MVRSLYSTVSPQQKKGETRNPKCHISRTMHFAFFVCDFSFRNPEIIDKKWMVETTSTL